MTATALPEQSLRGPGILYGTAWKKADTERLVAQAIRLGFRGIDTACQPKHYDEPGVGRGIAACLGTQLARDELFLQTKFTPLSGQDPRQVPYDAMAPLAGQIEQSLAASLRNLRTDYLDSLVLHSPLPDVRQTLDAWRAMESLLDRGSVLQLGISNCYRLEQLETLYASARVKPAVVQNRFTAETGYDAGIRKFCRAQRISYQSFWTLTANGQVLAHRVVAAIAKRYDRRPAEVLFRYLTQIGIVPLTGTRTEEHMRRDLAIFDFRLDDQDRAGLEPLFRREAA